MAGNEGKGLCLSVPWKRRCLALGACQRSGLEWVFCAMEFTGVALFVGGFVMKREDFIDVTAPEMSCGVALFVGGFVMKREDFIDVTAPEMSCDEAGGRASLF
ncbi:hypothetical protein, conserved [Eimeria tenella]|uniref:Uncharacterized protein n=1 Tax=Eimeria tenella TaxID=5802 RepID=U6L7H8_EIMTE|nr:hypothetical protein, conserved [Eimeria tenella]CDJ45163.1 hypothetical protein, conserved [Eimeria tenella]|eukprot:XP_013235910.1 hypothetical protein, conserved [Eimeria tenella]